jgi:hypothetical protein
MAAAKKITTPEFRLAFPNLLKPIPAGKMNAGKYDVVMLFPKPKTDNTNVSINAMMKQVAPELYTMVSETIPAEHKDSKTRSKKFELPFKDGDEKKDLMGYEGHIYVHAITQFQPPVVNGHILPIIDDTQVYGGCYGKAQVTAYFYNNKEFGKIGIGIGLNMVQITRGGESFGGTGDNPADVFSKVETDTADGAENPANYGEDVDL